jgi:hypothetical protein
MTADDGEDRIAALWDDDTIDDQQRIEHMQALAAVAPHPALGAFELGGAFDSGGHEAEADAYYAAATRADLVTVDPDRAAQVIVQHASTLRNLGRIDEAIEMLRDAPDHPATGAAPKVSLDDPLSAPMTRVKVLVRPVSGAC